MLVCWTLAHLHSDAAGRDREFEGSVGCSRSSTVSSSAAYSYPLSCLISNMQMNIFFDVFRNELVKFIIVVDHQLQIRIHNYKIIKSTNADRTNQAEVHDKHQQELSKCMARLKEDLSISEGGGL